jgi:hypothetical protein
LDITDEILWRWSQANKFKFEQAAEQFNLIITERRGDRLRLQLEFLPEPEFYAGKRLPEQGEILLTWPQVNEIMQAVKAKGVPQKDLRWKASYIGEVF